MCEDLSDWRRYEREVGRMRRKCRVWMMRDDNDLLLAWAFLMPSAPGRAGYDAQFYTRVRYRGKGYASLLMEKVREVYPNPYVFPHSKESGQFFKKHRETIRFHKWDEDWLK